MRFACPRCGRPGSGKPTEKAIESDCRFCRREKLHFDRCVALWTYHGIVRNAVVASKYGSQIPLGDALGRRLGRRVLELLVSQTTSSVVTDSQQTTAECTEIADCPDIVTAVPSHLWRRIQRGSGGSRVLAIAVAETIGQTFPDVSFGDLLATTRQIKKQAWLGEKDRLANVHGAFRVTTPAWRRRKRPRVSGKHILLVDDVMTTGATASEVARTLKEVGARRVTVAVVARAFSG